MSANNTLIQVRDLVKHFGRGSIRALDGVSLSLEAGEFVGVMGPSGSGKTTTALKIEEKLEQMGIETHTISMDDYFNTLDPETVPRNRG